MYYHIFVQYLVGDGKNQKKENCYEKDLKSLERIKKYYVKPFEDGKTIFTSGRVIRPNVVVIFRILQSDMSLDQIVEQYNNNIPAGVIMWYTCEDILKGHFDELIDITNEVMSGEL